jgi:diacylglycerol kinase (ATP)
MLDCPSLALAYNLALGKVYGCVCQHLHKTGRDMRVKVILNPWADHGRAAGMAKQIEQWGTSYGGQFDVVMTTEPGHGRTLAREALDQNYDIVAAAGGDGTVHEVVNGLVQGDSAPIPLGVIPLGSGNDFAFGSNLVKEPQAAVERLFCGQNRRIDLARIEDNHGRRVLVNNGIGIGFDATVTIQSLTITRIHGFAMYTLATLRTIAFYYRTPHLVVHFDDRRVEQDALLLAVGIGRRVGGGFYLTPDAEQDDNLLDSCLVNPVGRLTMLWMLPRVMKGTHTTSKHVSMHRSRTLEVISENMPLPIHIDGEIFAFPKDDVRRVTITSLPAALPIIY